MADDDDWETDPDFVNEMTEAQQRAFGNKETMDKYNEINEKGGGVAPGESIIAEAPKPSGLSAAANEAQDVVRRVSVSEHEAVSSEPNVPPGGGAATYSAPASAGPPPDAPPPPYTAPPPPPPPMPEAASADSVGIRMPRMSTPPRMSSYASHDSVSSVGSLGVPKLNLHGSSACALGEPKTDPAVTARVPSTTAVTPPAAGSQTARRASALEMANRRGSAITSARGVHARAKMVSAEEMAELRRVFDSFDTSGDGSITLDEMCAALTSMKMVMAREKVVAMLGAADVNVDGKVSFEEFVKVADRGKSSAQLSQFNEVIQQKKTIVQVRKDNIVHSFDEEETTAFVEFINGKLGDDADLAHILPITEISDLFHAVADGTLLCKLLNVAVPETIDERAVNFGARSTFHFIENQNLVLSAAKSVGLTVVNIGSQDMIEGRAHLVLGLIWQMVKMSLLSSINLKAHPEMIRLLEAGETLEDLLKLPPEKLLLRWVNYHLAEAGHPNRISNFGPDLKDSDVYCHLLQQIDPERVANTSVLRDEDRTRRAAYVVSQGKRLGAEFLVQPVDIVRGNEKLNLAFVAALFNACPGLDPPDETQLELFAELPDDDGGDCREERAFRMWINSLGIEAYVNNLFDDVRDGVVLLQTMDHVSPGVVEWTRVNKAAKMVFKRVENLNYAVELGKGPFKFSLVGVQGKDIVDGNRKLTLALIWQLFRYHLVSFLTSLRSARGGAEKSLTDDAMVRWANEKVAGSGSAARMRDFHDKSLASGVFLIDLLAAIEPRCVNREHVTPGATADEQALNAKYAISSARKIGCALFLLHEDIVDVRPKMILSFVASVMAVAMSQGR